MDEIEHLTDPDIAELAAKAREFLTQERWVKRITGGVPAKQLQQQPGS